jgi:hypothetical protein
LSVAVRWDLTVSCSYKSCATLGNGYADCPAMYSLLCLSATTHETAFFQRCGAVAQHPYGSSTHCAEHTR